MSSVLSFENLDSMLGKSSPFLISLSDGSDNELHIEIATAIVGEIGDGAQNDDMMRNILQNCRPVNPDMNNSYEIYFEDYIVYQIRNESFCSYDKEEIRNGKYLIVFKKSKMLEHLHQVTDACKFDDDSYYPGAWKHYGIYTQSHTIDIISHCEPVVFNCHRERN